MKHENLIKFRKEKGLTQKNMADKLAMEQTTYSKKERGVSKITDIEWTRFAKILDKDVEELKRKKRTSSQNENMNHEIFLNIIETIIKYNEKLEKENLYLKKQLNK